MRYRQLLGDLDEWFARGAAAAGAGVVLCRRGCTACCHGPFDISPADARLVATAVEQLDLPVRMRVEQRAGVQLDRYAELAPGWTEPWHMDLIDDQAFDRLSDHLADEPCPALGIEGECLIHESRPATCRMTGLAMETRQGDILENVCPILHTSTAFAELDPSLFDLSHFEDNAEHWDGVAMAEGWARTTVAGAIQEGAARRRHGGGPEIPA